MIEEFSVLCSSHKEKKRIIEFGVGPIVYGSLGNSFKITGGKIRENEYFRLGSALFKLKLRRILH